MINKSVTLRTHVTRPTQVCQAANRNAKQYRYVLRATPLDKSRRNVLPSSECFDINLHK